MGSSKTSTDTGNRISLRRMSSVPTNLCLAGMARVDTGSTTGFRSTLRSIASPNLDVRFKTRAVDGVVDAGQHKSVGNVHC
jgi:hypothetical protein